jgi:hypothetical protein
MTGDEVGVVTDPAHLVLEATGPANVDTGVVDGRILKRGGRLTLIGGRASRSRASASGPRGGEGNEANRE